MAADPNKQPKMPQFNMNWIYLLVILALTFFYFSGENSVLQQPLTGQKEATYDEFRNYIDGGYASKVVINKDKRTLRMYVKADSIRAVFHKGVDQVGTEPFLSTEIGSIEKVEQLLDEARDAGKFTGKMSYEHESSSFLGNIFSMLMPIFFLVLIYMLFFRMMGGGMGGGMGGIFNVGKSKAKMYEKGGELGITFKDVAGQAGAKQEIQEIVEFLKNPQKYTDLGGKIPKGALLVGPRARVRRCWRRPWLARPACRSSRCRVPTSSRCSSVWVPAVCVTCSNRPRRSRPASFSSTRLTPWAVPARRTPPWVATMNARTR